MKNIPRILPLVGVAAAGVLAVNALAGARSLPDLVSATRAMAEEAAKPAKGKAAKMSKDPKAQAAPAGEGAPAAPGAPAAMSALAAGADSAVAGARPAGVCAPTAAELAKEAGLSPAELQVLQSLGARRGQLDQRENDLNTQLALMAAAEAKLDAKVKAMNGLKAEIQGLMGQADVKQQAEIDRMVKVFEGMKPKDSAQRMVVLDDSVRLPIAAKMKERALSAMLAQMPPMEAKKLTEALSKRFSNIRTVAAGADQTAANAAANAPAPAAAAPPPAEAAAKPAAAKPTVAKPAPVKAKAKKPAVKKAPATKVAAASAPAAKTEAPAPALAGAAPAKAAAPATPAATAPAKPAAAASTPPPAAKPAG